MPYFFFLYQLPSSSLCTYFNSISSNIDEFLLVNPSANVMVFGDFNVHHEDWLIYFGGTHRSGELCCNFSILNVITQIFIFASGMPDCDSHSPVFLDSFLSSDASICSKMRSCLLGNSDHVVVSVSIEFLSYSQRNAPFHCRAYDYSHADSDGLRDHGRISLNSVLLLLLANFVSDFRLELTYISLIEIIRSSPTLLHGV